MNKLLQAMIGSVWFRRWSGQIGAFAFGLWFAFRYADQVDATLGVWGVKQDTWMGWLVAIAGAAGVGMSVALTVAKTQQDKAARSNGAAGPISGT